MFTHKMPVSELLIKKFPSFLAEAIPDQGTWLEEIKGQILLFSHHLGQVHLCRAQVTQLFKELMAFNIRQWSQNPTIIPKAPEAHFFFPGWMDNRGSLSQCPPAHHLPQLHSALLSTRGTFIQSTGSILVEEGDGSKIVFESHVTTKWCRMYSFENSTFPQLFSSTIFIIFLLIKKI